MRNTTGKRQTGAEKQPHLSKTTPQKRSKLGTPTSVEIGARKDIRNHPDLICRRRAWCDAFRLLQRLAAAQEMHGRSLRRALSYSKSANELRGSLP